MYAIARADGKVTGEEVEEIDEIAAEFNLFEEIKKRKKQDSESRDSH